MAMAAHGRVQLMLAVVCWAVLCAQGLLNAPLVDMSTAPHQTNLRVNGTHVCTATIITETWLVTAAQCVRGVTAAWMTVTAGPELSVPARQVQAAVVHPDFDKYTLDNDVALVRVETAFNFTSEPVRSIRLVAANHHFPSGWLANVTGFGPAAAWTGLRGANVSLLSFDECTFRNHQLTLTESMMCGARHEGALLQAGDAGGALVTLGRLAGVASHELLALPAVFTRLALPRVRSFVEEHAGAV